MDYQELLFAAAVRKRVGEIYGAHRQNFASSLLEQGDAKAKRLDEWEIENPLASFIKEAYNELVFVAERIREIRVEAELDARIAGETAPPSE